MSKKDKEAYIRDYVLPRVHPMDIVAVDSFKWWQVLSWISRWIRVNTSSKFSHVFLVGELQDWQPSCYTTDFKFRQGLLKKELLKAERFIIKRMPGLVPGQITTGLAACKGEIGKSYPYLDPISMWVQNKLDPGAYKLKVDDKDKICSQMVAWTYWEKMGIPLHPGLGKHWTYFTPADCISDDRLETIATW